RCEHQFAGLAIGHRLAGIGVDDLGVEVVFPHHRAIFGFDAFAGHTRPHDFGKPINVDRVEPGLGFDVLAHLAGPGLGAENADAQRTLARIDAPATLLFDDVAEIRWSDHDDDRPEIVDQLHRL